MKILSQSIDNSQLKFHAIVCALIMAVVFLLYYIFPVAHVYINAEDSWVEYATFTMYLLSSLLIAAAIKRNRQLMRPGYILFCLGFFIIAMEEISWGQRIIGVSTPAIIDKYNIQSEINIHNLMTPSKENIFYLLILIWALVLPVISLKNQWVNKLFKKIGIPLISIKELPYFLLSFFFVFFYFLISEKEFGEMILGLSFTLFVINIYCNSLHNNTNAAMSRKKVNLIVVSCTVLITTLFVTVWPNMRNFRWKLNEYATISYPQRGLNIQAQKIFKYLIKRKEMRKSHTYFEYGKLLKTINSPDADAVLKEALLEQKEKMIVQPKNPEPNRIAGKILKLLNQNNLAELEFKSALAKDENRLLNINNNQKKVKALKSMGETYVAMGDNQLALQLLNEALSYSQMVSIKEEIMNLIKKISNK